MMRNFLSFPTVIILLFVLISCNDDDAPAAENEEEVINQVTLSFRPASGGEDLVFTYNDPDGPGTTAATQDEVTLDANTLYHLDISFKNTTAENDEDLTDQIRNEGDEHQIFFSWTGPLFTSPTGLGNVGAGKQNEQILYQDEDLNGLPIGLSTLWETKTATEADFRIVLKHQPGIKSEESSSADGATDVDITWHFVIQ